MSTITAFGELACLEYITIALSSRSWCEIFQRERERERERVLMYAVNLQL